MKASVARREFLRSSLASIGLLGVHSVLSNMIIGEIFGKAFAQTGGTQPLNPSGYYIHFSLAGGVPRWYFDLPLVPHDVVQEGVNFNSGPFGTVIDTSGPSPTLVYQTQKTTIGSKSYYLPPVWAQTVGNYQLSDLLSNAVMFRGMNNQINSHPLANEMQVAPVIGFLSINGSVADGASRPIPSIVDTGCQAGLAFRDKLGLAPQAISYADNMTVNPAQAILAPFVNYMSGRGMYTPQNSALTAQAFAQFDDYAQAHGITQTALVQSYENAMSLVAQNITNIGSYANWNATKMKYMTLINNGLNFSGVFDQAIPISQSNPIFKYDEPTSSYVSTPSGDLRDIIVPGTTMNERMAQNFAVAELLLDKVTSNMVLQFPNFSGLALTPNAKLTLTNDQHFVGAAVACFVDTLYYRAFLGCMSELVTQLKYNGLYNNTILHVGAEFNRMTRADGSGADHNPAGSSATIFSGMLAEATVIGNIVTASGGQAYPGTLGTGANYQLGQLNRPIQQNDIARTITSMLGVDDIVTNGNSLFVPNGTGQWVAVKEEADNV